MHMKNRIQFSPIVTNHAEFESGRVTHALLDFVSTQAQTGCGLVTIGSTPVDFEHGRDFYGCLGVTNDNDSDRPNIWNWRKCTTRKVLWWMPKENALPNPPVSEADA